MPKVFPVFDFPPSSAFFLCLWISIHLLPSFVSLPSPFSSPAGQTWKECEQILTLHYTSKTNPIWGKPFLNVISGFQSFCLAPEHDPSSGFRSTTACDDPWKAAGIFCPASTSSQYFWWHGNSPELTMRSRFRSLRWKFLRLFFVAELSCGYECTK